MSTPTDPQDRLSRLTTTAHYTRAGRLDLAAHLQAEALRAARVALAAEVDGGEVDPFDAPAPDC